MIDALVWRSQYFKNKQRRTEVVLHLSIVYVTKGDSDIARLYQSL